MKTRPDRCWVVVVTSAPALCSLALLLANDWYLKAAYGNWLTGKLSDFAGILLLALIAIALLPRHRWALAAGICVAFAWWKSPLAQPFIDFLHGVGLTRVNRVVDYTDLAALIMVPLAWRLVARRRYAGFKPHVVRLIAAVPMMALCLISMTATSMASLGKEFEVRPKAPDATAERAALAARIKSVANDFGLMCIACEEPEEHATYGGGGYNDLRTQFSYIIMSDGTIHFSVYVRYVKMLLPDGTKRTSRKLVKALQRATEDYLGEIEIREVPMRQYDAALHQGLDAGRVQAVMDDIAAAFEMEPLRDWNPTIYERPDKSLRVSFHLVDEYTLRYVVHG